MSDSTLTTNFAATAPSGPAALFFVLTAQQPWQSSSRHLLTGVTQVDVRRGARAVERGGALVLAVPDQRLSSAHGRLRYEAGLWQLEDLGSKNGVLRNGVAVSRPVPLADGDVIEMGRSFFVFRAPSASHVAADHPLDVIADGLPSVPLGFASLGLASAARFAELARAASSLVSVVLCGETGTGKELAARAVHALSGRSGPLTPVNCGALPRSLLESELFGFTKGSFSGALHGRVGLIAASHAGTLFLDEIAELPLDAQAVLLRVLQEREVMPIGATRAQPVDLRVISASHRNLEAEVASGRFRADLFARLRGFQLVLPALRDRREDLGMIVRALLARVAPGREYKLSHAAARWLFAWRWPSNVRELERALQLATALAPGDALELSDGDVRAEPGPGNARAAARTPVVVGPAIDESERRAELERLLREHRGNVTRVAHAMGKAREQVHRWIKRARFDLNHFRS